MIKSGIKMGKTTIKIRGVEKTFIPTGEVFEVGDASEWLPDGAKTTKIKPKGFKEGKKK